MAFDWIAFLDQHGIEYVTAGPNTSRGHVGVKCVLCGDDPSQHLNISLAGRGWHCWRNRHPGRKTPEFLVQALIGCTAHEARLIVGAEQVLPNDPLVTLVERMQAVPEPAAPPLTFPTGFKPFKSLPSAKPFIAYLKRRGFNMTYPEQLTTRYDLHYCTQGAFQGRVIFPVYNEDNVLMSWTGRAIHPSAPLRYKALTTNKDTAEREGVVQALAPIAHHLLWYNRLWNLSADTIVLCEGPLDALKVAVLGHNLDVCATCFFTSGPTEQQVGLLRALLPRFKRRVLMLDHNAIPAIMQTAQRLAALDVETRYLPSSIKDPGVIRTTGQLARILY